MTSRVCNALGYRAMLSWNNFAKLFTLTNVIHHRMIVNCGLIVDAHFFNRLITHIYYEK